MNSSERNWDDLTAEQRLAALADGEISAADRSRAEEWLRQHPKAAEELERQRALAPGNELFWSQVQPQSPSANEWNRIRANIAASLSAPPMPVRRGLRWPLVALAAFVAAASVIAVAVIAFPGRKLQVEEREHSVNEVLAVLKPHEVEIESVRPADLPMLVVGESPLQGVVTLASYADVKVDAMQPDWDGAVPQFQAGNNTGAPMIFTPLTRAP